MRIAHIIAQLPAQTGSGIYYVNLIRALQAGGHEQRAVFACQDGAEFDFLPAKQQHAVEFRTAQLPFPIAGMSDIMPYPNTVYGRMNADMLSQWHSAFRSALAKVRDAFRPQVVILHHLWMLTSMAVELFPGALGLGICHNTDLRQAEQHPALLRQYARNIHRLDAVYSLSDSQRERIAATYRVPQDRIVTLGAGFDSSLFYPAAEKRADGPVQIVYASKIDRAKGVYSLLSAFRSVRAAFPDVQLQVVGSPDAENRRRLQEYLREGSGVTLHPAMPQRDLAAFFREMDIYVMPSFFEGLGLTALEALACGLRVVATENMGLKQLLGESVDQSGVIGYVPLPGMEGVDRPQPRELPRFEELLAGQLCRQISLVRAGATTPAHILEDVSRHSWQGIAGRVCEHIRQLQS